MKRYRMILKAHNFSINLMKKYDEMLYLQHKMIYNHRKKKKFSPNVDIIERVAMYFLYSLYKKYNFKAKY